MSKEYGHVFYQPLTVPPMPVLTKQMRMGGNKVMYFIKNCEPCGKE